MALNNLGSVALQEGDCRGARSLLEETLAIRRELGDQRGIAMALCNLGEATCGIGDLESARALLNESLGMLERLGDRRIIAMCVNNLGAVFYEQRDFASSRAQFGRSLEIMRHIGDKAGIAVALSGLAAAVAALGVPLRAAGIWGAAAQLRERIGSSVSLKERPRYEQRVAAARAEARDGAAFDRAWQEGAAMLVEDSIDFALQDSTGQHEQRVRAS
jgi:Tfp pilus assembly protein PilF